MDTEPSTLHPDVVDQAADWFAANRAGPLSAAARAAFVVWLRASPDHVEEYLAIARLAGELRTASEDAHISLDALIADAQREEPGKVFYLGRCASGSATAVARSRHLRRAALFAVAALLIVAGAVAWFRRGAYAEQLYQTAHGEQRDWTLQDGSIIHLNTDTRVHVRFTPADRGVTLEQGQALFEVAHEKRPFDVTAGGADVRAVGTRFDLYRLPAAILVTVIEGSVSVREVRAAQVDARALAGPERVTVVRAGQQLRIAGNAPAAPTSTDTRRTVAWLHRQIAFEQRPAAEVADEFNRYAAIPIRIEDPALRATPLSGVFNSYDTDSFVGFLRTLDGVTIERSPREIRVLRRTSH